MSRGTIYNLIDDGKLHRVKIGARAFIARTELERFVADLTEAAA